MKNEVKKNKRRLSGNVTSIAMKNTAIVRVDRVRVHPRYKKRYTVSKKYACDFRGDGLSIGDNVIIEQARPISKTKHWRIIEKV